MVSLHTPLSPSRRKILPEFESLFKRRKLSDDDGQPADGNQEQSSILLPSFHPKNPTKGQSLMMMMKSTLDTELHLETPIPLEWQRCLDIKSGQIYFYNTRTNKRMLHDPRSSPEPPKRPTPPPPAAAAPPPSDGHMSLDLELNLPCGSSSSSAAKNQATDESTKANSGGNSLNSSGDHHHQHHLSMNTKNHEKGTGGLSRAPSWLSFEGEQEMVAAACKKCHMLVMMSKNSPSCPNCKFLHPAEQSTAAPTLFKRRLSLLC